MSVWVLMVGTDDWQVVGVYATAEAAKESQEAREAGVATWRPNGPREWVSGPGYAVFEFTEWPVQ